jgi:hypothetical protein
MLLRRIHPPLQYREKERNEEDKRGKASQDLPEVAGQ